MRLIIARPGVVLVTLSWLLLQRAHAWETDQLTARNAPLRDAAPAADAHLDDALDDAVAAANARLQCAADVDRSAEVLAAEIVRRVGQRDKPADRKGVKALGYGQYTAWLEADDAIDRLAFHVDRSDVFGGIPWARAPILSMAGTCSTIELAGVRTGTDKADHFLDTGYRYYRKARGGHVDRAVDWGTWTENTWLGWYTSTAFSYGDLYANWQGYRFYASLFDPDQGLFAVADDGCIARVRDFHWADWVDEHWDELQYPTVYKPAVRRWLEDRKLPEARDALCADVEAWGPAVVQGQADLAAESDTPWVGARAKAPVDTLDLTALCGLDAAAP
ncbi:MAG: hypothetical protein H6733_08160 [Alphaproteobacteria bacterium]|nr:hypothetical protein [Alphaproteobacteria bacterium]